MPTGKQAEVVAVREQVVREQVAVHLEQAVRGEVHLEHPGQVLRAQALKTRPVRRAKVHPALVRKGEPIPAVELILARVHPGACRAHKIKAGTITSQTPVPIS